jgi:tetratricopeptide (TPR) repeat protein
MRWTGLVVVAAALIAANVFCVFVDQTPFVVDTTYFLAQSQCWADAFAGRAAMATCFYWGSHKAEEWTAVGGLALLLAAARFGPLDAVMLAQQLFLALLLGAVFFVTRRLSSAGGRSTPLLAAVVVGLCPIVFGMSRRYMPDVPLTAVVWIAIALLLAADGFRRAGASLAFGLACGVGMLMRPTFALFLAGPVACAVIAGVRRPERRGPTARGLALAALGALIALPWYWARFGGAMRDYRTTYAESLPWSWRDFGFSPRYLELLWSEQMGPVLSAFAALGVVRLVTVRPLRARYGALLAAGVVSVAIPFLVLGSMPMQMARYTLPLVPALAIALAVGLNAPSDPTAESGTGRRARRLLLAAAIAWGLAQFAYLSLASADFIYQSTTLQAALVSPAGRLGFVRPDDANHGLFGLDRRERHGEEICRALETLPAAPLRLLTIADRPCDDIRALHGVKWCLATRPFLAQLIEWPEDEVVSEEIALAIRAWPDVVLLSFKSEARLAAVQRTLNLEATSLLRAAAADGSIAVMHNTGPRADTPPPTIVRAGECVDKAECPDWCVLMTPFVRADAELGREAVVEFGRTGFVASAEPTSAEGPTSAREFLRLRTAAQRLDRIRRAAEAIAAYRSALQWQPDDILSLAGLAHALRSQGAWEDEHEIAERLAAVSLLPARRTPPVAIQAPLPRLRGGRAPALSTRPDNVAALVELADDFATSGGVEEELALRQRLLAILPAGSPLVLRCLERLHERGDFAFLLGWATIFLDELDAPDPSRARIVELVLTRPVPAEWLPQVEGRLDRECRGRGSATLLQFAETSWNAGNRALAERLYRRAADDASVSDACRRVARARAELLAVGERVPYAPYPGERATSVRARALLIRLRNLISAPFRDRAPAVRQMLLEAAPWSRDADACRDKLRRPLGSS